MRGKYGRFVPSFLMKIAAEDFGVPVLLRSPWRSMLPRETEQHQRQRRRQAFPPSTPRLSS